MANEVVRDEHVEACLSGGGSMGELMRSIDWSKTPIGAVATWSPTLRAMISFLLANRFPLLLWWGPDYTSIYNDVHARARGAVGTEDHAVRALEIERRLRCSDGDPLVSVVHDLDRAR